METTVLKAKTNLSQLLRKVESGEDVLIRRGGKGPVFRISCVKEPVVRSLDPDPRWKNTIAFKNEEIWESEWKDES